MAEHRTLSMSEVGVLDSSPESSCMRVRNMRGHLIAEYRGPIAVEIGLVFTRLLLLVKSRYGVPSSCIQLECAFTGFVDHDFVVEASCIFIRHPPIEFLCSESDDCMYCQSDFTEIPDFVFIGLHFLPRCCLRSRSACACCHVRLRPRPCCCMSCYRRIGKNASGEVEDPRVYGGHFCYQCLCHCDVPFFMNVDLCGIHRLRLMMELTWMDRGNDYHSRWMRAIARWEI